MLRPQFATLLDEDQRRQIVTLVTRFVDVLASPDACVDETHTPKLYAKFLHGQLRHVTVTTHQEAAAAAAKAFGFATSPASMTNSNSRQGSTLPSLTSSPETLPSDRYASDPIPANFLDLPPAPLFSHSTPGAHSQSSMSSAGSSVPTPGPDQEQDVAAQGWLDSSTEGGSRRGGGSASGSGSAGGGSVAGSVSGSGGETMATAHGVADDPMELCEDEFLATMQAISSDQWLNSVLMPGFRWPAEEPMPLGQEGELIFGGGP